MATLTLRPESAGDSTQWEPNTGANYAAVDEAESDSDTTYVKQSTVGTDEDDTYNIPTSALLEGATINSVTVYARAKYVQSGAGSTPAAPSIYQLVRVGGTTYASAGGDATGTGYADTSNSWATNPADSAAWEKADIDGLQIGIRAQATKAGRTRIPYVTQVWAVVDYTASAAVLHNLMMMGIGT